MSTKYLYWLAVEDGQAIRFADLPHMMAEAMHPAGGIGYGAARVNLDVDLPKAVQRGELVVRNPLDMGHHTFPFGDALHRAVMLPHDLRPFLESRGIELRLNPHGSGPEFWTIENAALAISEQEGWHDGARGTLLDQMMAAAQARELKVRDPHTGLHKKSAEVRQYWELVTPEDVNTWLSSQGMTLRWAPHADTGRTSPSEVEDLAGVVAKQDKGLFTVAEAAQLLVDANPGLDVKDLIERMSSAMVGSIEARRRLVRRADRTPLTGAERVREHMDVVTVNEVDEWLARSMEVPYRLGPLVPHLSAFPNGKHLPTDVEYEVPLHEDLEPKTPWTGGRMAQHEAVPLREAARLASRHAGQEVTELDFLRAGARGEIYIRAVVPRTVTMLPVRASEGPRTLRHGALQDIPPHVCEALSITGTAQWRELVSREPVEAMDGRVCRFVAWRLAPEEADMVIHANQCVVMGWDVHALADAMLEPATQAAPPEPSLPAVERPDASPPLTVVKEVQPAGPVFSMTRAALVTRHEHRWPTIQSDLKNASTNGLAQAKAGTRDWNESLALEWARANNKLEEETPASADPLAQAMRNLSGLPGRKNILKG